MAKSKAAPTPMWAQYLRLKALHPEALLMFRLGDFYELFAEDAKKAAPILEVQLTTRDGETAMCGVPYHAFNTYAVKLMMAGFTVAVAEQMEDATAHKGIVERKIVRVLTPGTYFPDDETVTPRVAVVFWHKEGWAMAVGELTTGTIHVIESGTDIRDYYTALQEEWERWQPDEYLSNAPQNIRLSGNTIEQADWFKMVVEDAAKELARRLETPTLTGWGIEDRPHSQTAVMILWNYLEHIQYRNLTHFKAIRYHSRHDTLKISQRTLRQLGVFSPERSQETLYAVVNRTVTPMGARELRQWMATPLTNGDRIARRNTAVHGLIENPGLRVVVRTALRRAGDVFRKLSRISLGLAVPRDLGVLRQALLVRHELIANHVDVLPWDVLELGLPALDEVEVACAGLEEQLPARFDDGNIIRSGLDDELDRYRATLRDQRESLVALEEMERDRARIKNLKIGYHRSFGYYLEVSRSQAREVPSDWHRRQTMTNSERFTSEALSQLEARILEAAASLAAREKTLIDGIIDKVVQNTQALTRYAQVLAELDVLSTLAEVAVLFDHRPPQWHVDDNARLSVERLRHPVLAAIQSDYVESSFRLEHPHKLAVITGPNMGGKSTFMRALALNVILAHMGAMVASDLYLPLCDAIFSRIGADDNIMRGQSTFMVEMEEMAGILKHASSHSLVILDELGRGTSTYDGLAIAHAVIETLSAPTGPYTLFATHYHELTELAQDNANITNYTVEVVHHQARPIFTHRIIEGYASQSYGVEVAAIAGLPAPVIRRARYYLKHWEATPSRVPTSPAPAQLDFYSPPAESQMLYEEIQKLDIDDLSPRDAWQWVAQWQDKVRRIR